MQKSESPIQRSTVNFIKRPTTAGLQHVSDYSNVICILLSRFKIYVAMINRCIRFL